MPAMLHRARSLAPRLHCQRHCRTMPSPCTCGCSAFPLPLLTKLFPMRLLLALILPFSVFFTIGRPFAGIFCLILQCTLVGWVPAAIWAVYALSQYKTDKKIQEALSRRH